MASEPDIDPDEFLLRRVFSEYWDTPSAFRPTGQDTDGISFYRERLTSADAIRHGAAKPPESYGVIRVRAAELLSHGLTLRKTRGNLPGHCVAVELNTASYQTDKKLWKAVQQSLLDVSEQVIEPNS